LTNIIHSPVLYLACLYQNQCAISKSNLEKELNDKKVIDDVKEAVQMAKKVVSDATGGALRRLEISKASIDAVKKLVESIPDALSFKNEKGRLPIQ